MVLIFLTPEPRIPISGFAMKGNKILVHGGGKMATKMAENLNIPQEMVDGRRITNVETLKIVTMVYAGYINKTIVAKLNALKNTAVGITGADAETIIAHKRIHPQLDFGFVGDIDTVNPDIVMIYNDPIVINQFLEALKDVPRTFKLWIYLDQVYKGCDQGLLRNIEKEADQIFCFTNKWMEYLKSRIPTTEKTLSVLEHGVDMTMFNRISETEKISMRKQLNLPADSIVFLNMNRNSERKRLDLSVMAFSRLLKNNPDLPSKPVLLPADEND
jgi:glycosyltransferase involved in cell wall biosynthesis